MEAAEAEKRRRNWSPKGWLGLPSLKCSCLGDCWQATCLSVMCIECLLNLDQFYSVLMILVFSRTVVLCRLLQFLTHSQQP